MQSVREIGRAARARGVPFHVDGVGLVGRLPLGVDECSIDLLTLSSNDLCGPPGAGALWVRPEVALAPIILGGGQEGGYRSGTENLPAIVGMGVAADLVRNERAAEVARLLPLRDRLLDGLLERVGGARVTGARELRVKESDRIAAMAAGLSAMGAAIEELEDGWAIEGPVRLRGAAVESGGDHRVAMTASSHPAIIALSSTSHPHASLRHYRPGDLFTDDSPCSTGS